MARKAGKVAVQSRKLQQRSAPSAEVKGAPEGGAARKGKKDRADEVRAERGERYGCPIRMEEMMAAHLTALLRAAYPHDNIPGIEPKLIGLFMVLLKVHRAAGPYDKPDDDDYVDAHNYLDFAREADDGIRAKS